MIHRKPFKSKTRKGPEARIQADIIKYLRYREWLVKNTTGNLYQHGLPDLYCAHAKYGQRWVEVKNPLSYKFTPAQLEFFPALASKNIGVWILVAATDDEYAKLFRPANWYQYLQIWRSGNSNHV